jgi:hypothetical protein
MAITDAYEILSNEEKKRNFDLFGHPDGPFSAQADEQQNQNPHYSANQFMREFFRQHQQDSQHRQYRAGQYRPIPSATPSLTDVEWHAILANSTADVWLVQFYAEGVVASYAVANAWEAIANHLSHCVRVARVHHHEFPSLAAEAGIDHVPSIVAVIDREIHLFEGEPGDRLAVGRWLDGLVPDVTHAIRTAADRVAFEAGSVDRVRLYFFTQNPKLSLTMRWAAFHFRRDIAIAVVARSVVAPTEYATLTRTFAVTNVPTLVLHREHDRAQHISVTPQTVRESFEKLRYARVPHLVKHRFEALCGVETKRTCIIYVHRNASAGGARALLAEARTNSNTAFAQAIGVLEGQQRSIASLRHGAPLIVWLLESDERAFVRSFTLPADHDLIALRLGDDNAYGYVTATMAELGGLFSLLVRDAEVTQREPTIGTRRLTPILAPLDQLASLVDDTTLLEAIQWRVRSWYRWVAQAVGMSSLFTTVVILYSLYGIICGRRRGNAADNAADEAVAAADAALRATGIMPAGREWLLEARMHVSNGRAFDSFAQIEGLVRQLSPAVFSPAFPRAVAASGPAFAELARRKFVYCVVMLERTAIDSPVCAEHYRFLLLKSLQCKSMFHAMFAIAQLNVVDHPGACLLLQTLNESTRRGARPPADGGPNDWETLPKLMAVELSTARAVFFRGVSMRSSLCSDWLELLVRNKLQEVAQWFDVREVLQ